MRPLYIYVCKDGFVLLGRPREQGRGDDFLFVTLDDVATVRRWGTSRGLGQLATEGPQPETKMDPEPDGVELSKMDVKRRIPCNREAWKRWPKTIS